MSMNVPRFLELTTTQTKQNKWNPDVHSGERHNWQSMAIKHEVAFLERHALSAFLGAHHHANKKKTNGTHTYTIGKGINGKA